MDCDGEYVRVMVGEVLLDRPISRHVCFEGLPILVCWILGSVGEFLKRGWERRGREVGEQWAYRTPRLKRW